MNTRHILYALSAAGAVAVAALLLADPFATQPSGTMLRPDDARLLALGQQVYQARCASCHGARLEGQPDWRRRNASGQLPAPPHDASGHTWHHADAVLFDITKYGVAKMAKLTDYNTLMPTYEGVLSDEEIVAVLSWIKAQWPPEVRAKHDQINAQHLQTRAP